MTIKHKVAKGETLWSIANQYNVNVTVLMEHNNLQTETIYPGDVLEIPVPPGEDKIDSSQLPSVEGGFTLPEGEYDSEEIEDISLMARLVYAESRGEPFKGQVAVAAVLLNRLRSPEFPETIHQVIYQPRQFEPVQNGAINNVPNNSAYEAVLEALGDEDPSEGALYFWNPDKVSKNSWVWTRTIIKRIGNHLFAK